MIAHDLFAQILRDEFFIVILGLYWSYLVYGSKINSFYSLSG